VTEARDVLFLRRYYHLPPNDPRLGALTEEEVTLEVELLHATPRSEDDPVPELQRCDTCGGWTYRAYCPWCPDAEPISLFDRLVAREERGEVVDWDEYERQVWGRFDRAKGA
jgi:hypothetical protein